MPRAITSSKAWSLAFLVVAETLALSLWFSASAVVPTLAATHQLSGFQQGLFTSAVQLGFVAGSLTSAVLGLADRLDPRRFFAASALVAALANAGLVLVDPASAALPLLRFVTGACMAGIYPVGMKLASTWAKADLGLLVGLLVGAVTLGSASPHLLNALGGVDWRVAILGASALALVAAGLILFAGIGPRAVAAPRFRPDMVLFAWRVKSVRLANFGYLGHMWELYAMWAWIGAFLAASFAQTMDANGASLWARLATFATVGIGALGCLAAGIMADRFGRTTLTIAAMSISGACALVVGLLFDAPPALLVVVCLVWGISIVADSAQFSASVAELSDPALTGTMLTLQTALGFTLTLITIHLMPLWVEALGWRYAFMPLAIGPLLGVLAMVRLRVHPDAVKLAGGRR
ncbi:MAG: MFS transporter [Reyranellaceae bacterium]